MCLRFADRPCFITADPTIFSQKIKKKRDSFPVLLQRSRILVPVLENFRRFDSIPYVVKPFTVTFGFCQSKMATFSSFLSQELDVNIFLCLYTLYVVEGRTVTPLLHKLFWGKLHRYYSGYNLVRIQFE